MPSLYFHKHLKEIALSEGINDQIMISGERKRNMVNDAFFVVAALLLLAGITATEADVAGTWRLAMTYSGTVDEDSISCPMNMGGCLGMALWSGQRKK
jgi:hypothetical protein